MSSLSIKRKDNEAQSLSECQCSPKHFYEYWEVPALIRFLTSSKVVDLLIIGNPSALHRGSDNVYP